ncbi:MAG TPA: hypothetical protein DEB10_09605 [Ruminococcaceae bacterium]|nr:hypothetical protein [Oscillospiraceae bacterium]
MTKQIRIKMVKKTVMYIACICMLFSLFEICLNAGAVSYSGRGSKSDPYLIYTAEQLDGIRDNLVGHYKLSNTIDLSSYSNFKPIGNLKTPFKGSLTCDLGADGKPLYAIKNLKMKVSAKGSTKKEKFSGYKKDGSSGWEAGLFGCADGSSFTNILIFDANITSTIEGDYQMNPDSTPNHGMDDMATGILVAIGKGITVKGCGVSGKVTSSSNHIGGMLGIIYNSNVSTSWSVATVTSTGTWGTGGLVGSAQGTVTITESFYNGTFTGGKTHAGAFGGSVYGDNIKIKDCWAAGTVKTESSGCFIGTKNHSDDNTLSNTDIASQCYTVGKIAGRKQVPTLKRLKNANFAAKEAGVLEVGFCAATQDEINSAFKAFPAWTVKSGSYPQLKNVKTAKASDYKPLSNQQNTTTGDNTQNTQGSDPTETTDTEPSATGTTDIPASSGGETNSTQDNKSNDNSDTDDDLRVMSHTAETLLVITLSILAAAALAGSVATIVVIVKNKPNNR